LIDWLTDISHADELFTTEEQILGARLLIAIIGFKKKQAAWPPDAANTVCLRRPACTQEPVLWPGQYPETEAEAEAVAFETEAKTEAVDPETEAEAARQYINKSHIWAVSLNVRNTNIFLHN